MGKSEYESSCRGNGAVSHINRAVNSLNNGSCNGARKAVKRCFADYPDSKECSQGKEMVEDSCN